MPKQTDHPLIEPLRPILSRVRLDITAIKLADGSRWTTEPLTKARMATHLDGGMPRGCCPIKEGESTTRLGLYDLDSHKGEVSWNDLAAVAEQLSEALSAEGAQIVPFRSSGGNGMHLFLLWDEPQDAYSVRHFMNSALEAIGYKNGAGGVQHHEIEIFPKQDHVAPGHNGNQFILPLAGKSVPLDEHFQPLAKEAIATIPWPTSGVVTVVPRPPVAERTDTPTEFKTLQGALNAIPNCDADDLDYDMWRDVIFGIHYATGGSPDGLALAHEFSARSSKYDAEFLDNRVWPYIDDSRDKPITDRTILRLAAEHGWAPDVSGEFDDLDKETPKEAPPKSDSKYAPQTIAEFIVAPPMKWLIKGVLPDAQVIVMYGAPSSGKSFMAIDMMGCLARGVPWRNRKVIKGRCAYIIAEGVGGARLRFQAYCWQHGIKPSDLDIIVIPVAPNFLDKETVKEVARQIKAAGDVELIVVDTMAQVMAGGNENSSEDVGKLLVHCQGLSRTCRCPVMLIHHCGKDSSKGARGWSGLLGNADAEFEVIRAEDDRALTVSKLKDGPDKIDFGFKLLPITLGRDEDGEDITSCIVEHTLTTAKEIRRNEKPLGDNEKIVWQSVLDMMEVGADFIQEAELIEATKTAMPPAKGRHTQDESVKTALKGLVNRGKLVREQGMIKIAVKTEE